MPTIEIIPETGWLGGFGESKYFGKAGSYDPASLGIDIFREIGKIQTGYAASNPTNQSTVTDAMLWLKPYITSTQKLYGYSAGGKLYEVDVSTDTVRNDGTFPRTVSNSRGQGMEIFNGKLLYASNGQVNSWDFASTFTEPISGHTGLATSVNGNNVLTPMKLFELTGRVYIASGNHVYSTDGTTMATSANYTLTFPAGTVVEDIQPIGEYLYIAVDQGRGSSAYRGKAKLIIWDGITPNVPNAVYDFPENTFTRIQGNGNEIYGFGGRTLLRWLGNTDTGGNEWQRLYDYNGEVLADMVDSYKGFVWFQDNASIFGFGSPRSLSIPKGLYSPFSGIGDSGSMKWVSNSKLYVARNSTPYLTYLTSGNAIGLSWKSKVYTFPSTMRISQVQVLTDTLASGDDMDMTLYDENNVATVLVDSAGNQGMKFSTDGAVNTKSWLPTKDIFYSVQIGFTFNGGAVKPKKIYLWLENRDSYLTD